MGRVDSSEFEVHVLARFLYERIARSQGSRVDAPKTYESSHLAVASSSSHAIIQGPEATEFVLASRPVPVRGATAYARSDAAPAGRRHQAMVLRLSPPRIVLQVRCGQDASFAHPSHSYFIVPRRHLHECVSNFPATDNQAVDSRLDLRSEAGN